MKKSIIFVAVGLVAAGGFYTVWRAASASTRAVTAVWATDTSRHTTPNYLAVTAWSDTGQDYVIEVTVRDATNQLVLATCISNDPTTPFDGAADPVILKAGIAEYPSGSTFSCIGTFKDAVGNVLGTATTAFAKP